MDDFQLVQLRYPEPDPEQEPSPEMLVALRDARDLLEQYRIGVVGKDFHNMLNMLRGWTIQILKKRMRTTQELLI